MKNLIFLIFRFIVIFIFFFETSFTSFSQVRFENNVIDSLQKIVAANNVDKTIKIKAYIDLSDYYLKSDLNKSFSYIQDGIFLGQDIKDLELIFKLNFQAGRVLFYIGLFDQVALHWIKSLEVSKELKNDSIIAKTHFNLSALYIALKEYEKADEYLKLASLYFNRFQNEEDNILKTQFIINNQAIIFQHTDQVEKADLYFQKSVIFAKENKIKNGLITSLNAYASFLFDQKRYKLSKEKLFELQEINKENFNPQIEATLLIKLARIEIELNAIEQAQNLLIKGYEIAKTTKSISLIREYSNDLYQLENKSGNTERALYYKILNDSLEKQEKRETASRNLEREVFQNKMIQFEQKILESNKESKLKSNITISILLLLLFSLTAFLYWKIKNNRAITMQNSKLKVFNSQLESKNKKLTSEVVKKQYELTSKTIKQIMQKELLIESIHKIQNEISDLTIDSTKTKNMLSNMIPLIDDNSSLWKDFDITFNEINDGFYQKLDSISPNLSINEKRLCAFLKIEMTSKEITRITGQSIRAIEIARTRLRKKLGLTQKNIRLTKYLKDL